jgi:pimeloyl-ACP methyl ester carboxylesterase
MNIALAANSTIVRAGNLALLRAYFGLVSHVLPALARRQAERLFTAPPPYAGRNGARTLDARRATVASGRFNLAVWHAGADDAPAVLLAHGWGGRGVQLESFVPPLVAAGHRVVWFDQPGHGESGRGAVAMPDFLHALRTLVATHGPFRAVVAHSFGAAALGVALRDGLAVDRVVLVSPPASMREHARNFARFLGITPRIREAMRRRLERRYGIDFADIDRIDELANVDAPALFVHDVDDAEVPFENTLRLSARMPNARVLRTYGLGHYRLLRDPAVVRAIVDFVRGDAHDVPSELPRLPRPAPLY